LDAGQLGDAVERTYERDELPDWELVFELSRRILRLEMSGAGPNNLGASESE
jgi:hypothetical protein